MEPLKEGLSPPAGDLRGREAEVPTADWVVFGVANFVNVVMTGIFLSRVVAWDWLEAILGVLFLLMAFPLGWVIYENHRHRREWWTVWLPALLLLFILVELVLDYLLAMDFRSTLLLWPYLILYYASLMVMVGYNFLVAKTFGWITLATYFLNLAAALFSYSQVGHG